MKRLFTPRNLLLVVLLVLMFLAFFGGIPSAGSNPLALGTAGAAGKGADQPGSELPPGLKGTPIWPNCRTCRASRLRPTSRRAGPRW